MYKKLAFLDEYLALFGKRYKIQPYLQWKTNRIMRLLRIGLFVLSNGAIFNDLDWPLTQIPRSRQYSLLNITVTVQDRHIFCSVMFSAFASGSTSSSSVPTLPSFHIIISAAAPFALAGFILIILCRCLQLFWQLVEFFC